MPTYYVATLASYVLAEAANETDARVVGRLALQRLHAETGGGTSSIEVRTVRLATDDEIELAK